MSYWVVQSFAVANPAERLERVRSRLSLDDDFTTLVDTGGETYPEVVALTTRRLVQPDMSSAYAVDTDEETLFGPFMSFVLEPGEYGCVLGVTDTASLGNGHIYTKRSDGSVACIDSVSGSEGGFGSNAAEACAAEYGFRPCAESESSLEYIAHDRNDVLLQYRGIGRLEAKLLDDDPTVPTSALQCPNCGERERIDCPILRLRAVYDARYRCKACQMRFVGVHRHLLPAPADSCPRCGGRFTERDLQYPELGSTAFECGDCDFVTFDTFDLDKSALSPDVDRQALVGPDVDAYREKHGVDSEPD